MKNQCEKCYWFYVGRSTHTGHCYMFFKPMPKCRQFKLVDKAVIKKIPPVKGGQ